MIDKSFAAITCYFNPCGYTNRERCFTRFAEGFARQHVPLWIIEAALPGHEYFVPESNQVIRIRLPEKDWLWQKERLLNLLIAGLPNSIEKVAWVDCDLLFRNDDWPILASEALNTWPVIQLFDFVYWLGPNDEITTWEGIDRRASLASIATHYPDRAKDLRIGFPGIGWAARRDLLEKHGLYENDVTGGGDSVTAAALFGWKDLTHVNWGTKAMIHDGYNYVDAVYEDVRGYIGYIPCQISHLWHGSLADRSYVERRKKLAEFGFDPFRDLEYDSDTDLLRWTEWANQDLREYVKDYFYSRREDNSV